jgi:hypothetical protein
MATYSRVTRFDSDGDGILDTSASGTLTREFDDHGNLFHDLSTIPDFQDESRFTYDANNNVDTKVTERHGTETSGLAKLLVLAADRGTDGVIDHRTISEQFTYDDQGRQITHTVDTDAGADGSINERSVYTTVYTNAGTGQSTLTVDTGVDGTVDKRFTAQNTYDQNNHLLTSDVVADYDGDGKNDYHEIINNVYDARGNLVSEHQEIDRDGNNAKDFLYTASHKYDAQDKLIWSEFKFDFKGDGTNDIETVVALTDQTTQTTDQTTQTTDQTTQTTDQTTQTTDQTKVALPDYFGLLDRGLSDPPVFADFDNGDLSETFDANGKQEGEDDGIIDSWDQPLALGSKELEELNHILSGGDPHKYQTDIRQEDGPDRRDDLVKLKELLEGLPTQQDGVYLKEHKSTTQTDTSNTGTDTSNTPLADPSHPVEGDLFLV